MNQTVSTQILYQISVFHADLYSKVANGTQKHVNTCRSFGPLVIIMHVYGSGQKHVHTEFGLKNSNKSHI